MRALRFVVATVVGFLLFQYVVLYLGAFLAADQTPIAYFSLFGHQYAELGHALLNFGLHTLPTALLIAGGVLATHRLLPTHTPARMLHRIADTAPPSESKPRIEHRLNP